MTVSDNVILGDGLQNFFKNLGKKDLNVPKKWQKNVLHNPTRALDLERLQQTLPPQLQIEILKT